MSANQIDGQGTFTVAQIRKLLEAIETGEADLPEHARPLQRILDAKDLVGLAEQLLAETVADARAIPAKQKRAVLEDGNVRLVDQSAADHSQARYGWDVIGAVLGITKQRAHKKFSGQ